MDPRSCYILCFSTILESSLPSLGVGFYDTGFHTSSTGLCRLGQDVPIEIKLIKGLELKLR